LITLLGIRRRAWRIASGPGAERGRAVAVRCWPRPEWLARPATESVRPGG